jgi:molybdopterin/thiamine biosynthesis adenylyltransferase
MTQDRLWASSGQRSLEQANVLLVGCDATGSQALKNLVLPGKPLLPLPTVTDNIRHLSIYDTQRCSRFTQGRGNQLLPQFRIARPVSG